MPKTISIELSKDSINNAIRELREYKKWVEEKTKELLEQLSLIGVNEASIRFAGAQYDGTNDVQVGTTESSDGKSYTYTVYAEGQAVCFIEFGAGVYYNTAEYPMERPQGIVGIGEYGQGKGNQSSWAFYGDDPGSNGILIEKLGGGVVITHGNPAAMPMYYASSEMKQKILSIAKEVFL